MNLNINLENAIYPNLGKIPKNFKNYAWEILHNTHIPMHKKDSCILILKHYLMLTSEENNLLFEKN